MTTPALVTLYGFSGTDGSGPSGSLLSYAGDLFGTTSGGGPNFDGTVFEIPSSGAGYGGAFTLVDFTGQNGLHPPAGLIANATGALLGTTAGTPGVAFGTVFEVAKTGGNYLSAPITLMSLAGADGPAASLIADAAGNLYGTTAGGGADFDGTVFEIAKTASGYASTPTTLISFTGTNGVNPSAALYFDGAGDLLGTTAGNAANPGGTVFEIAKTASGYATAPTTLFNFGGGASGSNPYGALIADTSGNLFGTTESGGATALNAGTIFEIPDNGGTYGTLKTLINFDGQDGANPGAGLIVDAADDLYGTTEAGGANSLGTVFELAKSGAGYAVTPTVLISFNGTNGAGPAAALIGDLSGDLFGTTTEGGQGGDGTVFEVTGSGFRMSSTVAPPSVASVTASPATGDLKTGATVTLKVTMSTAVKVSSDAPVLALNDGGNAAYDAALSTPDTLVFDYTVLADQTTSVLAVTALNPEGATIVDATNQNPAMLTGAATTFSGVEVNIPAPAVSTVAASPSTGNLQTGTAVTLSVTMTNAVTVTGGTPDLTLNDGGIATYDAVNSNPTVLVFDYTVATQESTTALAVTGLTPNGATIDDSLGNSADFTKAATTFIGLRINSTVPAVVAIAASPGAGDVLTGAVINFTATMSQAVAVAAGTPSLTLSDGGSANYDKNTSTATSLVFDYAVLSGQTATDLGVTGFVANGATVQDPFGNAAVMSGVAATFGGLQVNIAAPAVVSVTASPATGDVMTGASVTLTVTMSRAVAISGGTPRLFLNDGGIAVYDAAKSDGTALVFDYFPQNGQSSGALAVTGLNANGATIQDATGIAASFTAVSKRFANLEINLAGIVPPAIVGTASGQTTTDVLPIAPFANAVIFDDNALQAESLTVTLSAAANGALTNLGSGSYNPGTGVYTDIGSAAAVTAALDGLIFTPTAHQTPAGQTVTTGFTILDTDTATATATDGTASVIVTQTSLLGDFNIAQQLELIYIAYFGRAADGDGDTYWGGQNRQAQTAGASAATVLSGIANAFAPQPETEALYPALAPFLSAAGAASLNSPAGLTALTTFIGGIYLNLFGHAPDGPGQTYWVGQLSSGAVAIGVAALAIANGAIGADANEVRNKVAVATDFNTRTQAAGLGTSAAVPVTFLAAAKISLSIVDGSALNDASVTIGMNATSAYLTGATMPAPVGSVSLNAALTGSASIGAASPPVAVPAVMGATVITVTGSDQLIDPGTGDRTIMFIGGAGGDTIMAQPGCMDQVIGFDPATDVLDLSALFRGANIRGDVAPLGDYLTAVDQGADALVRFDPAGHAGGSTVFVLQGPGATVTSLDQLTAHGAIRTT